MNNARYLSGRIGSLSIATLLTYMDGGNADDCREQSQQPFMAVATRRHT